MSLAHAWDLLVLTRDGRLPLIVSQRSVVPSRDVRRPARGRFRKALAHVPPHPCSTIASAAATAAFSPSSSRYRRVSYHCSAAATRHSADR